ncbi:MAG: SRPBCC domain-containing protein [Bacteroidia bacterium]|nr:SRPBCC domain-containing protein [Bacteroidia bacterium]
MSTPKFITGEIQIKAPATSVWNALVNPEETKKYMFGCETVSDWKVGSDLLWRGTHEGNEMVFVSGKIKSIEPEKHLAYTTFDPHSEMADIPENYLTVTYDITESGGISTLKITQGDYSQTGEGEKRYNESLEGGGWNGILEMIKNQIEQV